jgi:hypothetical protein
MPSTDLCPECKVAFLSLPKVCTGHFTPEHKNRVYQDVGVLFAIFFYLLTYVSSLLVSTAHVQRGHSLFWLPLA